MKLAIILLAALLLLGCTGERGNTNPNESNATNITNATNSSNATTVTLPTNYIRFTAPSFSFEYPSNLAVQNSPVASGGKFTGIHELADRTGEFFVVVYTNTSATYGVNADSEFQTNPDMAAAGFLEASKINDSAGFLENAVNIGPTATFAIGRDVFVAEAPFTMKYTTGATYTGYALSMYVPERSLQVQARMLALDPAVAKQMTSHFLLSFRIE